MSLRRRSVLLRVALLVLVPLLLLTALSAYTISNSVSSALTLIRAKVMMEDLAQPVAGLQQALTLERAQMIVYDAQRTPAAQAALQRRQKATGRAIASLTATTDSTALRQSASAAGAKAIAGLRDSLAGLAQLRAGVAGHAVSAQQAFTAYGDMIAASYQVLEQAIIQEGIATQVLPGIAVIELAVSNEYLQQESALLNGDFAAHAFPASDHQAFARLVGAHRLLYAQSYSYLNPADRGDLNHDVSPQASAALAALENRLVAGDSQRGAPPVSPATWNAAVATTSAQTEHAVRQAEARLASGARLQADGKLRGIYLAGGLGLAAVIACLALSLWIAANLARQLRGLRDSALELANLQLPEVVRRLRAGEDVDVAAQVPSLDPGLDEIGQVKAAFNTAQRTAVEAAVDEARVRRGINEVFRNLARRSQSLLERQMALLDGLERRAVEPADLENLFRIDHLTTRMRRHAESLIVLAGDSPTRTFRKTVPFVDVLRAAAAEVEDYTRIRVFCSTGAALASPAVADVIHMFAEFAENATIFSPPNTEVRMTGDLVANGFAVDIEDRGLGLNDEELSAINAKLANPPLFDMAGSDRFGLFVAAQLARRHGIRATLRHSAYGGTTVIVLIPADLVVLTKALDDGAVAGEVPGGHRTTAVGHVAAASPVSRERPDESPSRRPAAVSLPGLPHSQPVRVGGSPELVAAGALEPAFAVTTAPAEADPLTDPLGPPRPAGAPQPALPPQPAGAPPLASPPKLTEHDLPQRVRQTSLAPQLRDRTASAAAAPGDPMSGSRSPEAARRVMSAFRGGWQRGLSDADTDHDHGRDLPTDRESRRT